MANQAIEHDEKDSSRTCLNTKNRPCVKLFGVNLLEQISEEKTMKSVRFGDPQCSSTSFNGVHDNQFQSQEQISLQQFKASRPIRKSKKWTEEEHIRFLAGMEKLGKGNWKRMSEEFVTTKTSAQIASHAQKYFLRLGSSYKRTPKSSVFNITLNKSAVASETRNQPQNVYMIYQPIFRQAPHLSNAQQPFVFHTANPVSLPIAWANNGPISALPTSWAMPEPSSSSSSNTPTDSPMPLSWAMPASSKMPLSSSMPSPVSEARSLTRKDLQETQRSDE